MWFGNLGWNFIWFFSFGEEYGVYCEYFFEVECDYFGSVCVNGVDFFFVYGGIGVGYLVNLLDWVLGFGDICCRNCGFIFNRSWGFFCFF